MGPLLLLRGAARAALDLLAPPRCLACGRGDFVDLSLCAACLRLVRAPGERPCPRCAAPLGPGADPASCPDCAELRPRFARAVAAAPYAGFAGELIRRAKYGHDPLLAVPLEQMLRRALAGAAAGPFGAVVPVPSSASRRAERGFHLADLLATAAAAEVRAPLRDAWLARVGDPAPQAALPRSERRTAARGTVEMRPARRRGRAPLTPHGVRVLLVDDVLTTGATANECARVLLAAGAADVTVAVAARA